MTQLFTEDDIATGCGHSFGAGTGHGGDWGGGGNSAGAEWGFPSAGCAPGGGDTDASDEGYDIDAPVLGRAPMFLPDVFEPGPWL